MAAGTITSHHKPTEFHPQETCYGVAMWPGTGPDLWATGAELAGRLGRGTGQGGRCRDRPPRR